MVLHLLCPANIESIILTTRSACKFNKAIIITDDVHLTFNFEVLKVVHKNANINHHHSTHPHITLVYLSTLLSDHADVSQSSNRV